jgi:hypothetical protein
MQSISIDPIVAFTALLVFATLLLAWIAWRQLRDARIFQRAYLGAKPGGLHPMDDGTVIAYVIFVNSGHLPASEVRNNVLIKWYSNEEGAKKKDFDPVVINGSDEILLLPKIEVERSTPALSKEGAMKYEARTGYVYVWGRVEYRDGFDQRWMIFCHRYNCSKSEIWRIHYHHNDGN